MSNKLKIILIVFEVLILLGLILLGVGCQRRWIVDTEDGPRLNWYGNEDTTEDTTPKSEPIEELSTQPEHFETTPPPVVTYPPVTTEPEETTAETTRPSTELEDPTPPPSTDSDGNREDEFPLTPVG